MICWIPIGVKDPGTEENDPYQGPSREQGPAALAPAWRNCSVRELKASSLTLAMCCRKWGSTSAALR